MSTASWIYCHDETSPRPCPQEAKLVICIAYCMLLMLAVLLPHCDVAAELTSTASQVRPHGLNRSYTRDHFVRLSLFSPLTNLRLSVAATHRLHRSRLLMTDSVADGAVDRAVDRDADAFSRRRAASGNSCPELTPVGWATRRSVPGVATLAGRPVRRAIIPCTYRLAALTQLPISAGWSG